MAKKKNNEIAVGLTVLVVMILTVFIVVTLADWQSLISDKLEVTVHMPYNQGGLKGLEAGSPVQLGGLKVGEVTETKFIIPAHVKPDDPKIHVSFTMAIVLPEGQGLYDDCVLLPQSNVLGSLATLSIQNLGGGPASTLIKNGDTISKDKLADSFIDFVKEEFDPGNYEGLLARIKYEVNRDKPDSIFSSLVTMAGNFKVISEKIDFQVTEDPEKKTLMTRLHSILLSMETITENINTQLDKDNPEATIARLNVALGQLDENLREIKDVVTTAKPDITGMLRSLKHTAETLEKDIPVITEKLKSGMTKAETALETANVALNNLKEFTASAKDVMAINRDRIDQLIGNITEVSVNLKLVSREVRRAPWKLLYKPSEKEQKIQHLVDSAGAFAAGAERLDHTASRLELLMKGSGTDVTDSDVIQNILTELESSFKQFQKAEQKFWEDLK
ncbi:MAG: hypothetical protein K9M57_05730 [Phycisphaerae bacterium]|nr:hypothetical protein [Phycisphaerae bacterium]